MTQLAVECCFARESNFTIANLQEFENELKWEIQYFHKKNYDCFGNKYYSMFGWDYFQCKQKNLYFIKYFLPKQGFWPLKN